jgi:hypothetical protein
MTDRRIRILLFDDVWALALYPPATTILPPTPNFLAKIAATPAIRRWREAGAR